MTNELRRKIAEGIIHQLHSENKCAIIRVVMAVRGDFTFMKRSALTHNFPRVSYNRTIKKLSTPFVARDISPSESRGVRKVWWRIGIPDNTGMKEPTSRIAS